LTDYSNTVYGINTVYSPIKIMLTSYGGNTMWFRGLYKYISHLESPKNNLVDIYIIIKRLKNKVIIV